VDGPITTWRLYTKGKPLLGDPFCSCFHKKKKDSKKKNNKLKIKLKYNNNNNFEKGTSQFRDGYVRTLLNKKKNFLIIFFFRICRGEQCCCSPCCFMLFPHCCSSYNSCCCNFVRTLLPAQLFPTHSPILHFKIPFSRAATSLAAMFPFLSPSSHY
jgi:hypothetical protein